jgi:hypothetical protein
MKVGGYDVREHMRMLVPSFGLIAAVWLLRLVLDALGAPLGIVRVFSVSGAAALAVLITVGLIHFRCTGGYPNVILSAFLLVLWEQLLIISAIVFSVVTNKMNIYTRPEYSFPGVDPNHIKHILGQLTFGVGAGTLYGAAAGCALLWLLRRLVPTESRCEQ